MNSPSPSPETDRFRMTPLERRASQSLGLIYALRLLGLFMVLPVFALEARRYPGGDDPVAVGLAMGMYGLVQACLQIPLGLAADRFGRKRIIVLGMLLFAAGSAVAALAPSVHALAWGRGLQGAGAVSAAVTALLADQTRDSVRTKGMALIGASIGLTFALSLVLGPLLADALGLAGIFWCTAALALAGVATVLWWTPPETTHPSAASTSWRETWRTLAQAQLWRLNFGVFVLHAVQLATWVAVPALLLQAGIAPAHQAWVYLPTVLMSFVVMGVTLFPLERKGHLKPLFIGAVALLLLVQVGWLAITLATPHILAIGVLLFLFFCGFNILEASQPSLVSRWASPAARGAALGVYNTLQSLGVFTGGACGGWLAKSMGAQGLFMGCLALMTLWLVVVWGMAVVPATPQRANTAHTPV